MLSNIPISKTNKILIIDDDAQMVMLLAKFLSKHKYEVQSASSHTEAEKLIDSFNPDLILSESRPGEMDASVLLERINAKSLSIPVIIITGHPDIKDAVNITRLGAFDYITKPIIPGEILISIAEALAQDKAVIKTRIAPAKPRIPSSYLLTNSVQSKSLEHQISLVAPTNYSVIICGESGVGKEGAARMVHDKSSRSAGPFVAVDCGTISRDLACTALFGHEQGAFTGAIAQKLGHFEKAHRGTLFLDEVSNLPYETQTLLLRVLQEKVIRRVGGNTLIGVDVRIIVASSESLIESVRSGKFREDLYYRLNEFAVEVAPLRKRRDDIVIFARYFLEQAEIDLQKTITGFEPGVKQILLNYPWYGNVRELKNVIRRAALQSTGKISAISLPIEILNYQSDAIDRYDLVGTLEKNTTQPIHKAPESEFKKGRNDAQHEAIISALTKTNFNRSKAAGILGIHRKTLYSKMKQMQECQS